MPQDSHMWIIVIEIGVTSLVQLVAFAFFYGRLTERVKTLGERQSELNARVDRLEERIDHL